MTYIAKPKFHHKGEEERARLHAPRLRGQRSRPCAPLRPRFDHGLDHRGLLRAVDQPHRVAKISGIGCSSKTTDYFSQFARLQLGARPHAVGPDRRQPRHRDLIYLGVSGDGDSASHRFGQFRAFDPARRHMTYVVREQWRLRLTKGQFSLPRPRLEVPRRAC